MTTIQSSKQNIAFYYKISCKKYHFKSLKRVIFRGGVATLPKFTAS